MGVFLGLGFLAVFMSVAVFSGGHEHGRREGVERMTNNCVEHHARTMMLSDAREKCKEILGDDKR